MAGEASKCKFWVFALCTEVVQIVLYFAVISGQKLETVRFVNILQFLRRTPGPQSNPHKPDTSVDMGTRSSVRYTIVKNDLQIPHAAKIHDKLYASKQQ